MSFNLKSPWIGLGLAVAVAVPFGIWAGGGLSDEPARPEGSPRAEIAAVPPPSLDASSAGVSSVDAPNAWDGALRGGDDAWYAAVVATTSPSAPWSEDSDMWDDMASAGADAWDATVEAGADAVDWTADSGVVAWDATVEAGSVAWDWSADAIGSAAIWTGDAAVTGWDATVDALDATGEAIGDLFE